MPNAAQTRVALIELGEHPEWRQFLTFSAVHRANELNRLRELLDIQVANDVASGPPKVAPQPANRSDSRLLGHAPNLGWTRAVAYYTSYLAIWRLGVPNIQVFWATIYDNIFFLALSPARFLGSPLVSARPAFVRTAAGLLFLLLGVVGVVRQARTRGWNVVHYAFPFYLVVIALWNYSDRGNRFFLPFLFLVIAAVWTEVRRIIVALSGSALQKGHSWLEKVCATFF